MKSGKFITTMEKLNSVIQGFTHAKNLLIALIITITTAKTQGLQKLKFGERF